MQRLGANEYSGHVGDGGLQGHSVGGLYPLIVYGAGINPTRFGVMNGATGEDTGPIFEDYGAAAHVAELVKELADVRRAIGLKPRSLACMRGLAGIARLPVFRAPDAPQTTQPTAYEMREAAALANLEEDATGSRHAA